MSILKESIVLITGGTGSFGSAFVQHCLNSQVSEIRILSRNRQKQNELIKKYNYNPKINFFIGDIKDKNIVDKAMTGVTYVFHMAAIKHIPICEKYPMEAINVNVIGSDNVINSAIENNVKGVICFSTDKAVYPISTMGITKSCMEKIALQKAKEQNKTKICIVRFCNLLVSSGNVFSLFLKQIKDKQPITVTDLEMTRFFITTKQAIELVERALNGNNGDIFIRKGASLSIEKTVEATCMLQGVQNYPIQIIGSRAGEKKHEVLFSKEEEIFSREEENYIIISMNPNLEESKSFYYQSNKYNIISLDDILELVKEVVQEDN